ncbi:MAG TPA: choice-of-anchor D domain-containing protein [Terriglobia bacterium]|nr:choice-of-anchor D domain-containing protein [Terriglobia bacterium]
MARRVSLLLLAGFCLSVGFASKAAALSFTIGPSSLKFGNQSVKVASSPKTITVTNTGKTPITVMSFTITGSAFQLNSGTAPNTIMGGQNQGYRVVFAPTAVGTYTGTFTFCVKGSVPTIVTLSGTGISTGAISQVTPNTLSFGNQTEGTASVPQTVTISNIGTTALKVMSVKSSSLNFTVQAPTNATTLNPGQSLAVCVTFAPSATVAYTGTLEAVYDVLPVSGAAFTGTGTAPTSLIITSLANLPPATQSAAYLATLQAASSNGPLTWQLYGGTTLPTGLTLSSAGVISGTLDPSVQKGTYSFTIEATDSVGTDIEPFSLTVDAPTGAACNNISWNIANTTMPLVPVTDLGTGTYLGTEGGLYCNGSNVRPAAHDAAGVALAQAIQPLDANGNPDPLNGKEALVALGISTAHKEFNTFANYFTADPLKNPKLVVVNGAQGGESLKLISEPTSPYWTTILNYFLPNAGVTNLQVVAVWIEDIDPNPTGTFPADITTIQTEYETLAQTVHTNFPNATLAYYSSRIYAGYSNGIAPSDPEPYAYESAFAVRGAIEDQLNGDPNLNYDPTLGAVKAPWMAWGPYDWSNGMLGRLDGLVYTCQDFEYDGYHPADPSGQTKVTDLLLNFFKTDDTTTPWFLAH